MLDFYNQFYAATEHSAAHHAFCERVFGKDLTQHGFADMAQVDLLIDRARIGLDQAVLDIGCGTGQITEYISDVTGAHVTGLDFAAGAIDQAQRRTTPKLTRLDFAIGDINDLQLQPAAYDTVTLIDTIYFSADYVDTLRRLQQALRLGGKLAIYYSYGREPWVPVEQFPAEKLPWDRTPLAEAFNAAGLAFRATDVTSDDYRLAVARREALDDLRPQFEAEGNLFLYANRIGDANGIADAIERGLQRRYLYLAE